SAKLFFSDDSVLNLGEKCRVRVQEYLLSPEKNRSKSIYQLIDGTLKVVVGRSDLQIHTQTAVAAARGTVFFLWGEPADHSSCLMVLEGTVLWRNRDEKIPGELAIEAGQTSCVPPTGAPARGKASDEQLLRKLTSDTYVLGGGEGALDAPPEPPRGAGPAVEPALDPADLRPPAGQQPESPLPPPPPPPPPPPGPPAEEQQPREGTRR
ncbi:MAG: FecR domain-containing protein, partial [Candidatus Methylomirabilia bacterium]